MRKQPLNVTKAHLKTLGFMAIFGFTFALLGGFIPQFWLRYIDKTEYIQYVGNVTFDKNEYAPCETQVAQTTFIILIDTPIRINSRLYLQKSGDGNTNEVIKEFSFDSFLARQPQPQVHLSRFPLPCDLQTGIYFYRGILNYKIKGVEKVTSFASDQFTVR